MICIFSENVQYQNTNYIKFATETTLNFEDLIKFKKNLNTLYPLRNKMKNKIPLYN